MYKVVIGVSWFHENAPPWRTTFRVHNIEKGELAMHLEIQAYSETLPNEAAKRFAGETFQSADEAHFAIVEFATLCGVAHRLQQFSE